MKAALFSSDKTDWETPQDLFDKLNAEFSFTLDAAADEGNTKCAHYFTEEDDALSRPWPGRVWCNPPYGRNIGKWVEKAKGEVFDGYLAHGKTELVVILVPARTDTKWWGCIWDYDEHCPIPGVEVRFLKGRLRFGDGKNAAPFPSALIVLDDCRRESGL